MTQIRRYGAMLPTFAAAVTRRAVTGCREQDSQQRMLGCLENRQRAWRRRVLALRPPRLQHKRNAAVDCVPTFLRVEPRPHRFCWQDSTCPFCYGRRITRLAVRFVATMRQLQQEETPYQVAVQRQRLLLPYTPSHRDCCRTGQLATLSAADAAAIQQSYRELCTEFGSLAYWREAYRKFHPDVLGGIFVTTISPGRSGWEVALRRVVILPAGVTPVWPALRGRRRQQEPIRRLWTNAQPRLMRPVLGWLWAYPHGWLTWPRSPLSRGADYAATRNTTYDPALCLTAAMLLPIPRLSGLYGICRRKPRKSSSSAKEPQ